MSTWTFQTQIDSGNGTVLDAVSDHGTTIASYFDRPTIGLNIYRSTDGGFTWSHELASGTSGGAMGKIIYAGVVGGNKTWFVMGCYPGFSYVSTDDGQTWTRFTDTLSNGIFSGAGDDTGYCIASPSSASNFEATTNGSHPFTSYVGPSGWANALSGGTIWDGTQFVALAADSGPTHWSVFTAPSGFTSGSGPNWTQAGVGTANQWIAGAGTSPVVPSLAFLSGVGYVAIVSHSVTAAIVISSTPGGLASAAVQVMSMDSGSAGTFIISAGLYLFWGNLVQNIYRSTNGTTWTKDTLSQALQSGEKPGTIVYDSVNNYYILFGGNAGSVYNSPAAQSISISPTSESVPYGGSFLFSITTVPAGLAANWSVNGILGGDGPHGTVSNGYYVAPPTPNGIPSVTVTATRQDIPSLSASAAVTLTTPTFGGGGGSGPGGGIGGTGALTGKFRGPKVFKPVMLAKAATIPLRIYEPNENKTFKG